MLSGLSFSHSSIASSGVVLGPSLTPIGLAIREMKSTCAPSSCRVRSPIQRKCPDSPYARRPETRVSARSYSRARASCEQYSVTVRSASSSVMPQARMKASARSISRAIASYRSPAGELRTKPLFQSCTACRSASPPAR